MQVQRAPAASGDPLHELVGARLAQLHGTQQPAVGNTSRVPEHACRVGRAIGDVAGGAAGRRPGRRRRQDDIDDQRCKRQREKTPRIRFPFVSVAQPQQPGDRIRHDEKRHVDRADDHFPPRWLRHLEVLLQPDGRHDPEEQPSVDRRLQLPESGCPDQCRRAPAQVVQQQHHGERQPVPNHQQHLAAPPDARGDQSGGDVDQQPLAVECHPGSTAAVHHNKRPGRDRQAARDGQSTVLGRGGVRLWFCRASVSAAYTSKEPGDYGL